MSISKQLLMKQTPELVLVTYPPSAALTASKGQPHTCIPGPSLLSPLATDRLWDPQLMSLPTDAPGLVPSPLLSVSPTALPGGPALFTFLSPTFQELTAGLP